MTSSVLRDSQLSKYQGTFCYYSATLLRSAENAQSSCLNQIVANGHHLESTLLACLTYYKRFKGIERSMQ